RFILRYRASEMPVLSLTVFKRGVGVDACVPGSKGLKILSVRSWTRIRDRLRLKEFFVARRPPTLAWFPKEKLIILSLRARFFHLFPGGKKHHCVDFAGVCGAKGNAAHAGDAAFGIGCVGVVCRNGLCGAACRARAA
ncbi:MAG: hypothetical protein RSD80_02930, partial [Raoultibacter sp.]